MRSSLVLGAALLGTLVAAGAASASVVDEVMYVVDLHVGAIPADRLVDIVVDGAVAAKLESEAIVLGAGDDLASSGAGQLGEVTLSLDAEASLSALEAGHFDAATHALVGNAVAPSRALEPVDIAARAAAEAVSLGFGTGVDMASAAVSALSFLLYP